MSPLTLSIDQSTQGTKVFLIDPKGNIVYKTSQGHKQIINDQGWISHDLREIKANLKTLIRSAQQHCNGHPISGVTITNQRESAAAWRKSTGEPLSLTVVWQDNRAEQLLGRLVNQPIGAEVKSRTGLRLSPYFSAGKFAWLRENVPAIKQAETEHDLCFGTMDSWVLYTLTDGREFKTEPSNACRTQLMNIHSGDWDPELLQLFNIDRASLPAIVDSDSTFGGTDLFGTLAQKVPITSLLADSQAALFAEDCAKPGQVKVTFGTGSSIVLNTGQQCLNSDVGLNTSIAWRKQGQTTYILEGNVNYSGAIVTWLKDQLHLITEPAETDAMAQAANPNDTTMLIPAFTGLAAPYNYPSLKATLMGMTMTTGRNELVCAGLNAVIYQITDILRLMQRSFNAMATTLHADGGMIRNTYLMQRLSNISQMQVDAAAVEELSGLGTALNGGAADHYQRQSAQVYGPQMPTIEARRLVKSWQADIDQIVK